MENLVAPAINLILLVALLIWKLKIPLREYVSHRHVRIRDEIKNVREQLKASQDKYEEFSARVKTIDSEAAVLKEQARQDAQSIRTRTASEAQRLSAAVVSDARGSATHLYAELKTQLYQELATRVLGRSELLIRERLTKDDKARLRQEFSLQVEGGQ